MYLWQIVCILLSCVLLDERNSLERVCVRFQRDGSQCYCAKHEMTYCARVHQTALSPARTMKTTSLRIAANRCPTPRMQMQNRSWPIFSALIAPHCLRSTFLSPSPSFTINLRVSFIFPLPLVCYAEYHRTGPADKLISTGKSCSSSCTSYIRSPPFENPSPQSGTKNLSSARILFFRLLSHEHVAVSPFAFYSSFVIEKAAATLSAVC